MGSTLSALTSPSKLILSNPDGNGEDYQNDFVEGSILGNGQFGTVKILHRKKGAMKLEPISNMDKDDGDRLNIFAVLGLSYKMKPKKLENSLPLQHPAASMSKSLCAVKMLHKGYTIKNNVIYAPIFPHVLKRECDILRELSMPIATPSTKEESHDEKNINNYTLQLHHLYESPTMIYIITEFCSGGDLIRWTQALNDHLDEDKHELEVLDIYIISRIIFQLLSAVNHCAQHGVIHRDIKPENIMFESKNISSDLRLIDFGSSAMDYDASTTFARNIAENHTNKPTEKDEDKDHANEKMEIWHKTMAGTPFYSSPELFQRRYSYETDVWSTGVILYVLVKGHPKSNDILQEVFDIFHDALNSGRNKSKARRNLEKELPDFPDCMPQSYYDLLNALLTYDRKNREPASVMLTKKFPNMHKDSL